MKCQNLLDSGLAANDGYFWQEVTKKFQEVNEEYNNLAYTDFMFVGVNPSIKLQHNWSSFWRFTRLSLNHMVRSLRTLFKKSENHDDFIDFCVAKSEVYYLYLWLQKQPQLDAMVVTELPQEVFWVHKHVVV